MTGPSRHPLDHAQLDIPQRLRDDLAALYPPPAADARRDVQISAHARSHFTALRRRPRMIRLTALATAAAAAVLALLIAPPVRNLAREDVNRDGRVDIRDALVLARRIESNAANSAALDITGDRIADRCDVDAIALAAVRLDHRSVR